MATAARAFPDRMAVTRVALKLGIGPGCGADLFRVGSPVAVAVDIVAYLGYRIIARRRPVSHFPFGGHLDINRFVQMFC